GAASSISGTWSDWFAVLARRRADAEPAACRVAGTCKAAAEAALTVPMLTPATRAAARTNRPDASPGKILLCCHIGNSHLSARGHAGSRVAHRRSHRPVQVRAGNKP